MDNVSLGFVKRQQEQLDRAIRQLEGSPEKRATLHREAFAAGRGSSSSSGGDGVDTRIINLERDMTDVKVSLGKVETRLEHIEKSMLTKGQTAAGAMIVMTAVIGGAWWIVQQYLAPILASLPAAG